MTTTIKKDSFGREIGRMFTADGKTDVIIQYPYQAPRWDPTIRENKLEEEWNANQDWYKVKNMGESNSRYSIVENLTKEKAEAFNQVKHLEQSKLQIAKNTEDLKERQADELRRHLRDTELSIKQIDLEIRFQTAKAQELSNAIEQIAKISKEVNKTAGV